MNQRISRLFPLNLAVFSMSFHRILLEITLNIVKLSQSQSLFISASFTIKICDCVSTSFKENTQKTSELRRSAKLSTNFI
jgi:hypothetical protein